MYATAEPVKENKTKPALIQRKDSQVCANETIYKPKPTLTQRKKSLNNTNQGIVQKLLITDIPSTANNKDKYKEIAKNTDLGILWLMASEYKSRDKSRNTLEYIVSYSDFDGTKPAPVLKDTNEKITIGAHGDAGNAVFSRTAVKGDDAFKKVKNAYSGTVPKVEVNPMFCTMLHSKNTEIQKHYSITPSPTSLSQWDDGIALSPESGICVMKETDCTDAIKSLLSKGSSYTWNVIIDNNGYWEDITTIATCTAKTKWNDFKVETNKTPIDLTQCELELKSALDNLYNFIKDPYNAFLADIKTELTSSSKPFVNLKSPWK
ncbi:MAG: hypothetical protein FWE27_00130 [Defluviitaleaceae bacterium]|nr:hypothetical protein [Defluviitaleaceae bacterium]